MIQNLDLNQQHFSSIGRLHSCSHDILKNVSYTSFPSCAFLIGFGWFTHLPHQQILDFARLSFNDPLFGLANREQPATAEAKDSVAFWLRAKLAAVIWSQSGFQTPRASKVDHRNVMWVCLKMSCTPKPNGFADHYPYEKWLFHWEYTQHFQTNPCPKLVFGMTFRELMADHGPPDMMKLCHKTWP